MDFNFCQSAEKLPKWWNLVTFGQSVFCLVWTLLKIHLTRGDTSPGSDSKARTRKPGRRVRNLLSKPKYELFLFEVKICPRFQARALALPSSTKGFCDRTLRFLAPVINLKSNNFPKLATFLERGFVRLKSARSWELCQGKSELVGQIKNDDFIQRSTILITFANRWNEPNFSEPGLRSSFQYWAWTSLEPFNFTRPYASFEN